MHSSLTIVGLASVACSMALSPQTIIANSDMAGLGWTQSYDTGYTDGNGAYAGGSESMHLVAHKGKLGYSKLLLMWH